MWYKPFSIINRQVGDTYKLTVDTTAICLFLGVVDNFKRWFNYRWQKLGLLRNHDFVASDGMHYCTIETVEKIVLLANYRPISDFLHAFEKCKRNYDSECSRLIQQGIVPKPLIYGSPLLSMRVEPEIVTMYNLTPITIADYLKDIGRHDDKHLSDFLSNCARKLYCEYNIKPHLDTGMHYYVFILDEAYYEFKIKEDNQQ
jgi:hypothetical protein